MFSLNIFATAQIPDFLKYNDKTYRMHTNPLDTYFSKENPPPKDFGKYRSAACWRGYVAFWKIENGYLYLEKVLEGDNHGPSIPLTKLFKDARGSVKATWYSGIITIPKGKQLKYVHMGYRSKYEKELKMTFDKGKLIKEWTVNNKDFEKEIPPPIKYSNAKIKEIQVDYKAKENKMSGIKVSYTISPSSNKIADKMGITFIIKTRDGKKATPAGDKYKLWWIRKGETGVNKWISVFPDKEVSGSLFFPWSAFSMPKGKHDLTGYIELSDLSKVISSKSIDFWYKSKGPAPQPTAEIEKIWVDQNQTVGEGKTEKKGFNICLKFKTKYMHTNDSVRIRAYLTHKDGSNLTPVPHNYNLSSNRFGTQKWLKPRYKNSVYTDLKLFFEYKALPLTKGEHDLLCHVEIYDKKECFAKKDYQLQINFTDKTVAVKKIKIICPKCGKEGVRIVYGKPGRKTMEKANKKEIYLGGCDVWKDAPNPKYHCYHCGNNWGEK